MRHSEEKFLRVCQSTLQNELEMGSFCKVRCFKTVNFWMFEE